MLKQCFFGKLTGGARPLFVRLGQLAVLLLIATTFPAAVSAQDGVQEIRLANTPALSPDGSQLAFEHAGDLWIVDSTGGQARRLTSHESTDRSPVFSPDGGTIAFASSRSGSTQVWTMPTIGGAPTQLTYHTAGCVPVQYTRDGEQLLITSSRDYYWRDGSRFFLVNAKERSGETLLFDAHGDNGSLSTDGKTLLFTREGVVWWRKGYQGSQASQIWKWDGEQFSEVVLNDQGARSPLFAADGKSFYYVGGQSGAFNLYHRQLDSDDEKQLTSYEDDSVVMPCISADGNTMVYRHLFDFYRMDLSADDPKPSRIKIVVRGDQVQDDLVQSVVSSASDVAFTDDGLEIAVVSGGDVWVMDTELREPKRVTDTAGWEHSPVWAKDNQTLYFIGETDQQSDLWQATRSDEKQYWWQNDSFELKQLTNNSAVETDLGISPDGEMLSYISGNGDLVLREIESGKTRTFLESWNAPSYDWSPDSKWIVYAVSDNDFNSDVFVKPLDGSHPAVNLSLHPDNDRSPVWSPDGKMIAFTGRQFGEESDIFLVYLQAEEDQETQRDRKLEEALEKMKKGRKDEPKKVADKPEAGKEEPAKDEPKSDEPKQDEPKQEAEDKPEAKKPEKSEDPKKEETDKAPEVKIDFDGIGDRTRQISIPQTFESGLIWSPDSKKLAFVASIDGKRGLYSVSPPDEMSPKLMTSTVLSDARWLGKGNVMVGLQGGTPASMTESGKTTSYGFTAKHSYQRSDKYAAAFQLAWREMRDNFYDPALNNRNWNEIFRKYLPLAKAADSDATFGDVVNLMLGELNGSHLGFYAGMTGGRRRGGGGGGGSETREWRDETVHFGLRFVQDYNGPGLKVRDVILESPAWKEASRIEPGEIVLAINGTEVDPAMDLTQVLNGQRDEDWTLKVQSVEGKEREVSIRPISFSQAAGLLYDHYVAMRQKEVEELSDGKFGYLHIRGMNQSSFYRFERELFKVAGGKEGLIIDVRDNGGGSTADHLLTSLTQPRHAFTIPRNGGVGYPADRMIYARWYKPVVVLCNQNSFSNAEIFSHAIKTLERGQVVGVPTAGGVISTGGTGIMDVGFLRKPFRGWYLLNDGEDMELNGCVPHHVLWPAPGEMPKADDRQLAKALEVLTESVKEYQANPLPKAINASDRRK